ncbi:MAG: amino acid-binding protein [Desulfobacterales bacterium]|jgi:hypothetical protein
MRIRQVSVFMEKALERFREITELFRDAGINIRAHSLVGHIDTPYKILRMIVDDTDKAVPVLKNRGLSVKVDAVLAVEVDHRTGGLCRILEILDAEGLELRYTYAAAHDVCQKAAMVLSFDDLDRAVAALTDKGVALIASEQF